MTTDGVSWVYHMTTTLGIRREDKNRWEQRVPLIPEHILELTKETRD